MDRPSDSTGCQNPAGSDIPKGVDAPPRLLVERVAPELDGGRYAAKRTLGDRVDVQADVLKDGHDLLAARICYRGPGDEAWAHAPMRYDFNSDRWSGTFSVDRVGMWRYTVEAWTDVYGSWCVDLEKRVAASHDVSSELLEGAALLTAAAARARADDRGTLARVAALVEETSAVMLDRVQAALDPELRTLVGRYVDDAELVRYPRELRLRVDPVRASFAAWYEMFPRSQAAVPGRHGTFADAERQLSRLAALGFDVVYLPPIHPIGRTFRKGPNNTLRAGPQDPGSPWAIGGAAGGHTAVEPSLGTLDDFDRFVRAATDLGLEVALDYALQCSPDHPWATEHPEWFFVRPDGSIKYAENPPKKYQDIYPLNFWSDDRQGLWDACRDVLLFWVRRGVRIFRVDNPHTKPLAFWEWVIREVQERHPEVTFLAEAFTRPKRLQALAKLGFTQSYTYFTWRNTAPELREYLTELTRTQVAEYLRGNFFANTPDILPEYLQTGGRAAFRVRLILAATLSPIYGIYSGFELCEHTPLAPGSEEYLDSEKFQIRQRTWDAPGNINDDIRTINRIRRDNAALHSATNITFHQSENEQLLCYRRSTPDGANDLVIIVNLDPGRAQEAMVHVPVDALGLGADETFDVDDLLSGARYTWRGVRNYVRLDPQEQVAHVLRVVRR